MRTIKYFFTLAAMLISFNASAQIELTPVVDATIGGLTANNIAIAENRLRSIISSYGMESGYDGHFVLACKIAALERNISGNNLIQHIEVTFAIGDNVGNKCFGTTSVECIGIGQSQGQAMTSALKNIRGNDPKLQELIATSKERIIGYYEAHGAAIIAKARSLITAQEWEEALLELTAIPRECSVYPQAVTMMNKVYQEHINHDAAQILNEARALWSADPNPGPAAEQAMSILSQIDTQAKCYPQAKALMTQIENRVKNVTDKEHADEVALEKQRISAETALENARIKACRDIATAYAKQRVVVQHHYHYWW